MLAHRVPGAGDGAGDDDLSVQLPPPCPPHKGEGKIEPPRKGREILSLVHKGREIFDATDR
jgi:hypothetical protein